MDDGTAPIARHDSELASRPAPVATGARVAMACAMIALACGGPPRPPEVPDESEAVEDAGAVRVLALPRPTEGQVWLSLWIDAGTRDAATPSVATLAAFSAADTVEGVEARALADGIELFRTCPQERLGQCLAELARAAGARAVTSRARAQLDALRLRVAADAPRRADALALGALLGAPIDPLGADEIDDDAVAAFLADHFGAGRLFLVVVGDVDRAALRGAAREAFSALPPARAARGVRAEPAVGAAVEVGDATMTSVATLRPDLEDALAMGRRLVARLGARGASAEVFPLRGGAALMARTRGGDPEEGAAALLDAMAILMDEHGTRHGASNDDDPLALARAHGAAWVTRGPTTPGGLGLGVVVDGGRGDRLSAEDPDVELRERLQASLSERVSDALAAPEVEGRADDRGAELDVDGAHVRVRRLPGVPEIGLVVRFRGGALEEPAGMHGITALLARVAELGCARVATEELGQSLEALGATVRARVGPEGWSLSVSGPRERWAELSYLGARCAVVPHLDDALVERARMERVGLLARTPLRAELARLLSGAAPGRVAPHGSARGVAGVSHPDLRRWRTRQVARRRVRIALVGDVPVGPAARRLARFAARLPEGPGPEPVAWAEGHAPMIAVHRDEGFGAVVAWSVPAEPGAAPLARAFAEALARSLGAEPGLAARWSEGGAVDGRAWAAVALEADATAIEALPAHVRRATAAVAQRGWDAIARRASEQARAARAASGASSRGLALRLTLEEPDDASPEVLRALAGATPRFVIARAQPGHR